MCIPQSKLTLPRKSSTATCYSMSNSALLKSSLAKKYWMAATGLFLCLFLAGHLAGNLQLIFVTGEEGRLQFNEYALFMTSFLPVKILSYLTYISILFHAIDGVVLSITNRKARPIKYFKENAAANSTWSSRNMGVLGTVILVFIISHMSHFWYVMHYGSLPIQITADGVELKDLYTEVMTFFNPNINSLALPMTILYVLGQIALAFHLIHGFQSAFQSLGARHPKYTPLIRIFGMGFAILVPALFAIIPIVLYITQA